MSDREIRLCKGDRIVWSDAPEAIGGPGVYKVGALTRMRHEMAEPEFDPPARTVMPPATPDRMTGIESEPDPFREQADAYTRLSEEYTAYVLRARAIEEAARAVLVADGAAENGDDGADRAWDASLAALQAALDAA